MTLIIPKLQPPVAWESKTGGDIPRELIKEIAMDIGKETAAYVEVMYPEAMKAASSTFPLSLRNHVYNEIMAAIELNDAEAIRARLKQRQAFRRKWRANWRKIRSGGK